MPRVAYNYRTTSREVYKKFKLKYPELILSYVEWCNIIYSFNYGFRDYCLETGKQAKFPFGLGVFCITKFKPIAFKRYEGQDKINLPVDWKKTKEKGFRVFHLNNHTEGYKFRWYWVVNTPRFFQSDIWTFKPSRASSRLIKHYIDNDYSDKYQEWKNSY